MGVQPAFLVIACGALAREIVALRTLNNWPHMVVQCLPAELHNRPEKIPAAVRAKIQAARDRFTSIFVAYADCGTGKHHQNQHQPVLRVAVGETVVVAQHGKQHGQREVGVVHAALLAAHTMH